jgi:hypothetical protein
VDDQGLEGGGLEIFGRRGGLHEAIEGDKLSFMRRTPSLQALVEEAEQAVAAKLATVTAGSVATTGFATAPGPLEAALARYFTIRDRHEDEDAVSLVITDRCGDGFQGVVTEVKRRDGSIEVSLEVSGRDGATIRYDGPASGDIRSLAGKLARVMNDVDSAGRDARRRG